MLGTGRLICACFCAIICLLGLTLPQPARANGGDYPAEIIMQGFLKVEDGRAILLVRVPLVVFAGMSLPKRGPGYLDLANIDARLRQAAAATGRQIELTSDGATLAPALKAFRLAFPSDRSFASYSAALAHLQEPPLPESTELFATQGYLDLHFEYSLPSNGPNVAIRVNATPDLGQRVKLRLEYVSAGPTARTYELAAGAGRVPLEPRWYEAAWLFAKAGFSGSFAIDRFVFLLCLIAPFRNFRGLLALVLVFAASQAVTLTAAAEGALVDVETGWLALLSNTVLAAAIVLLAIANLAAPALHRRWLVAAIIGGLGGFGLGRLLSDAGQLAGTHPLVAVVFFNVGVAIAAVVSLGFAFFALRLLFSKLLAALLGVVVLSAVAGHAAWHGMLNNGSELGSMLERIPGANLWPAMAVVSLWLLPAVLLGVIAYFLPKPMHGAPFPTLLRALQGRITEDGSARPGSDTPRV